MITQSSFKIGKVACQMSCSNAVMLKLLFSTGTRAGFEVNRQDADWYATERADRGCTDRGVDATHGHAVCGGY